MPYLSSRLPHEDTTLPKMKSQTFNFASGRAVRLACRNGDFSSHTSGLAPTYLQANLIALPSRYADDFRLLCQRNPVPCPLLAESAEPGNSVQLKSRVSGISDSRIAEDVDLTSDFPKYMVYSNSKLRHSHLSKVAEFWTKDHVAFLIGCSYSFEAALVENGLTPPHVKHGRNVSMYRTKIPLLPAGVFQNATYVVSMRVYNESDIERVRTITRPYAATHGEPIAWGWDGAELIGIEDIANPEWGDAPATIDGSSFKRGSKSGEEDLIPVFWGCGVTPQEAVMRAGIEGTILAHAPGHMLVLDAQESDLLPKKLS